MTNDSLKSLIETLTAKEKTVFKRYSSIHSENKTPNYVILFDIYNRLIKKEKANIDWNEQLNNALRKHPKVLNDLPNLKKRLKDKLLESLLNDQMSTNQKMQSSNSVNILGILYERKLYSEMQSKIKQLKKLAVAKEWYKTMVETIDWESKFLLKRNKKGDFQKVKELCIQQQIYLKLYSLELQLQNICNQMNFVLEADLQLKKSESRLTFDELGNHPIFKEINIDTYLQENRIRIILWYYKTLNLYLRFTGQFESCYENSKILLQLFEKDEKLQKDFKNEYIPTLCSFTRICFRLQKKKELGQVIEKVRSIYMEKKNFDALSATCDMGVPHYINTFQFDKAKELITILSENWIILEQKVSEAKMMFYAYHCFLLYWILGATENQHKWTEIALKYSRSKNGKGLFFLLQILNLTTDFDNNDLTHFDKKIETTQKTIQNNEHLAPFEKIIFQYIKKLYNIKTSSKNINLKEKEKQVLLLETFSDFKTQLESLKNSTEKFIKPTGYEEVMLWIESRLQNTSIRVIFEASVKD